MLPSAPQARARGASSLLPSAWPLQLGQEMLRRRPFPRRRHLFFIIPTVGFCSLNKTDQARLVTNQNKEFKVCDRCNIAKTQVSIPCRSTSVWHDEPKLLRPSIESHKATNCGPWQGLQRNGHFKWRENGYNFFFFSSLVNQKQEKQNKYKPNREKTEVQKCTEWVCKFLNLI